MSVRVADNRLTGPLGLSALLHLALAAAVIWSVRPGEQVKLPPVYKVNIVAAPPGPRAIGEVKSGPTPAKPVETPTPRTREVAPVPNKAPTTSKVNKTPAPTKATPTTSTAKPKPNTEAPKAGGGPKGGTGSDVATVQTEGIDFPYQGYLNNIVRQIALNFKPKNPNSPLRAQVRFLIRRNGTVSDVKVILSSGVWSFDTEARGAVEKAAKSFGPLPDGFQDDVLPVVFSFDPKFLQ